MENGAVYSGPVFLWLVPFDGIMGVWVLPYQSVTEANFYDCITAERQDTEEERPADPYGYDYRSL